LDKYEYKVRSDEIKDMIARNEFAQAAEIADTIDWRRVKSVTMLCTISDLYKANRRYEDAKNVMLLAYERRPGGRMICYSLCELCIKTEEFVQAVNYYKEFVQAAPKDSGRYILQYKLYEAQDVSLEERIEVLEELKKRDYREKWAYELAYLYHRVGLPARCVEECDELILWFGEGKYVVKAMELKMLHEPLSPEQQVKYEHRFDQPAQEEASYDDGQQEYSQEDACVQDGSQWDADGQEGQWEAYAPQEGRWETYAPQEGRWETYARREVQWDGGSQTEEGWVSADGPGAVETEADRASAEEEEMDIQVKTMDVGQYNTINLQAELAAGLQEVLGSDRAEGTEVFFGETGEMGDTPREIEPPADVGESRSAEEASGHRREEAMGAVRDVSGKEAGVLEREDPVQNKAQVPEMGIPAAEQAEKKAAGPAGGGPATAEKKAAGPAGGGPATAEKKAAGPAGSGSVTAEKKAAGTVGGSPVQTERKTPEPAVAVSQTPAPNQPVKDDTAELVLAQMRMESLGNTGQDTEEAAVEKQITGQLNIEDILAEWEQTKKDNEEKCREEVRQHVLQQTGPMFTEFEAAVRDGLLERLEQAEPGAAKEASRTELAESAGGGKKQQPTEPSTEERAKLPAAKSPELPMAGRAEPPEAESAEQPEAERAEQPEAESAEQPEAKRAEQPEAKRTEPPEAERAEQPEAKRTEPPEEERAEPPEAKRVEQRAAKGAEQSGAKKAEHTEQAEQSPAAPAAPAVQHSAGAGHAEGAILPRTGKKPDTSGKTAASQASDRWKQNKEIVQMQTAEMLKQITEAVEAQSPGKSVPIGKAVQADEKQKQEQTEEKPEQTQERLSEKKQTPEKADNLPKAEGAGNSEISPEIFTPEELPVERDAPRIRSLTREERELYAPFIQSRSAKEQLVQAIDNVSMAAYTGNVVVTGEEGMDTLTFAKNMARELKMIDSNFSGRVAKISGKGLNQKDVEETLWHLNNGALIIYHASGMDAKTAAALYKSLQQEHLGIVIIMEDTKKAIQRLFLGTPELFGCFTARMDLEALSNDTLVSFGRKYAREMEYSIDEMGVLALHTRIEELQTIDHVVTVIEVKKIVDEAIRHACRKTLGHFFDILFAKRYDEEDMIILTEKDFA